MLKHSLGIGILCSLIAGCSGSPNGSTGSDQGEVNGEIGEVSIPLIAQTDDVLYRLVNAKFTMTGAPLGKKVFSVTPPADEPVHTETLPVGAYSILLEDGWKLQSKSLSDMDAVFVPVDAALISPNPDLFTVVRNGSTDVVFRFVTAAGVVNVGRGKVNIRIDVQGCSTYDQFTAALGGYTVDCLGTIGPKAFSVDQAGNMHRNFAACKFEKPDCDPHPQPGQLMPGEKRRPECLLNTIDDLLSIQNRTKTLPMGQQCIAGRWTQWRDAFLQSGIVECPNWTNKQVFHAISPEVKKQLLDGLPKLPVRDTGERLPIAAAFKTLATYDIAFEGMPPSQKCETPEDCAIQCAGGFPGFIFPIGRFSTKAATTDVTAILRTPVITDPTYWLDDGVYDDKDTDPYSGETDGYFHPMSFYGPIPGAIAGHRDRALLEEPCSFYLEGEHFGTRLELDCLNADYESCISICLPP